MKNIILGFILIVSSLTLKSQCRANFTYWVDSSNTVSFVDSSDGGGNFVCTYFWDFGDSSISFEQNPVHSYSVAGNYDVCLIITTASDSSCSDTICSDTACEIISLSCSWYLDTTITPVSTQGACDGAIDITVYAEDSSEYQFVWNNGDTSEDITNLCAGTYSVTVSDDGNCRDSLSIVVLEPDTFLYGYVFAKDNYLPQGMMLLLNKDYKVIKQAPINSGRYGFEFYSHNNAEYTLYAVPFFDIEQEYYPQYFPTYSGDSLFWQQSQFIINDTSHQLDIHLQYYDNLIHGSGYISGTVYVADEADFETSIYNHDWFGNFSSACQNHLAANVTVLLKNTEGAVLKSCLTNNKGAFRFAHLPLQNYILHIEKSGKTMQQTSVSLTTQHDTLTDVNFTIKSHIVTDVEMVINSYNVLSLYPNPFKNRLVLEGFDVRTKKIEILNSQGQIVFLQKDISSSLKIDTEKWSKGIYFLRVITGDSESYSKKLIKL
jgi:hypothetical protein